MCSLCLGKNVRRVFGEKSHYSWAGRSHNYGLLSVDKSVVTAVCVPMGWDGAGQRRKKRDNAIHQHRAVSV